MRCLALIFLFALSLLPIGCKKNSTNPPAEPPITPAISAGFVIDSEVPLNIPVQLSVHVAGNVIADSVLVFINQQHVTTITPAQQNQTFGLVRAFADTVQWTMTHADVYYHGRIEATANDSTRARSFTMRYSVSPDSGRGTLLSTISVLAVPAKFFSNIFVDFGDGTSDTRTVSATPDTFRVNLLHTYSNRSALPDTFSSSGVFSFFHSITQRTFAQSVIVRHIAISPRRITAGMDISPDTAAVPAEVTIRIIAIPDTNVLAVYLDENGDSLFETTIAQPTDTMVLRAEYRTPGTFRVVVRIVGTDTTINLVHPFVALPFVAHYSAQLQVNPATGIAPLENTATITINPDTLIQNVQITRGNGHDTTIANPQGIINVSNLYSVGHYVFSAVIHARDTTISLTQAVNSQNSAPVASWPLYTLWEDSNLVVDLDPGISDRQTATFQLTVELLSQQGNAATASLIGHQLRIVGIADSSGTGTVQLRVSDPDSGSVDAALHYRVDPLPYIIVKLIDVENGNAISDGMVTINSRSYPMHDSVRVKVPLSPRLAVHGYRTTSSVASSYERTLYIPTPHDTSVVLAVETYDSLPADFTPQQNQNFVREGRGLTIQDSSGQLVSVLSAINSDSARFDTFYIGLINPFSGDSLSSGQQQIIADLIHTQWYTIIDADKQPVIYLEAVPDTTILIRGYGPARRGLFPIYNGGNVMSRIACYFNPSTHYVDRALIDLYHTLPQRDVVQETGSIWVPQEITTYARPDQSVFHADAIVDSPTIIDRKMIRVAIHTPVLPIEDLYHIPN